MAKLHCRGSVLLSCPTTVGSIHTQSLKLFQEPFQIYDLNVANLNVASLNVASLKDTLKGRVTALKLAKLSNVLFMQLPNFTTESISRNLFS